MGVGAGLVPAPMAFGGQMNTPFVIHSVVRKVHHRTFRAQAPAAIHRKQYIGGEQARLVPGAKMHVSEEWVQRNLPELQQKHADRIIEVRTADGRLVDLTTMTAAPADPVPPMPHPLPDSVARDVPTGQYIPPYVGDDNAMPQVLQPGQKPDLLTQQRVDSPVVAEPPTAPPPADDELEAALAAAQEATGEEVPTPAAPAEAEHVSSGKGRRSRR